MIKYTDTQIGFQEFPDEISLLINISNCPFHCPGCHSPELWKDVGTPLTFDELDKLISNNSGITLVGFMGGVSKYINILAGYVSLKYNLKVGWYTGDKTIPDEIDIDWFDYIKLGPYIKELGGLDNPNTNQKFYSKGKYLHKMDASNEMLYDVTYKFWKHGK